MPPVELPRRMFAGARMRFLGPLAIGEAARRRPVIRADSGEEGRAGKLVFVTVAHSFSQGGTVCLEEAQDIVYRGPGAPVGAPRPENWRPPDGAIAFSATADMA
jgi:3-methylfumaryl-CoA hydratase